MRGSLTAATVEIAAGTTSVTVTAADLHGGLLTAATPATSSQRPTASLDPAGTVTVGLASDGLSGGTQSVNLVLASGVRWTVDLDGGATTENLDLRATSVVAVSLGAGVTRATIALPASRGKTTLRETGGASDLTVSAPRSVATYVRVNGGASSVQIGSTSHSGVSAGTVYQDPRYATAADRLDVELVAGVSSFRLLPT
jgi:hypothetical protein